MTASQIFIGQCWATKICSRVGFIVLANATAKLPGPPARTLKLGKPGWRPRSAFSRWLGFGLAIRFWPRIAFAATSPIVVHFRAEGLNRQFAPVADDAQSLDVDFISQVRQRIVNAAVTRMLQKGGEHLTLSIGKFGHECIDRLVLR